MLVLFFVVFIDTVGFGIILPLQPFFAKELGASDSLVTLVASSYTGAQLLFAPMWGALSDRIGRRTVLLLTVSGTALGYVWLAFTDSLWMLFLARAFGGAMAANIGVAHAYVADISGTERRARDLGRVGAAAGLGFVAGPAIGGLLAGPDPLAPAVQIPFLVAGAASALAALLAALVLREPARAQPLSPAQPRPAAGGVLSRLLGTGEGRPEPQFLLLLALMFMTQFVFTAVETTLALWSAQALGWGATQNGILYTFMGAVAIATLGLSVGPLVARLGERGTVLAGGLAACAGTAVLPLADGYAGLMVSLGLLVFGISAINPSLNSLISHHGDPAGRGRLMGAAQRSAGFGRFVGPAWGGVSFEFFGRDWPSLTGAAVMAAMVVLALRIARMRLQRP